jgi:3-phenylpropionate/trans-cinnamate dioxygenase ferredoxin subunit
VSDLPEGFAAVAEADDIAPGAMIRVAVDRLPICLANVDGAFYAIRDVCGHRNAPLSRGTLSGPHVECPLHYALFDVRDGRFVEGPLSADVPAYEVRVVGGRVHVRV